MEWISTKEREPEEYEPILFVVRDKNNNPCTMYGFAGKCDYTQVEIFGTIYHNKESVLYWIPLPEPPMEGCDKTCKD